MSFSRFVDGSLAYNIRLLILEMIERASPQSLNRGPYDKLELLRGKFLVPSRWPSLEKTNRCWCKKFLQSPAACEACAIAG